MLVRQRHHRIRRGAVMIEAAIVLPILLMLFFGLIFFGIGMLSYQQVTSMAREGSRFASVHGASYQKDTGQPKSTPASVYSNAMLPMAVGLDPSQITYSVTWDDASQSPVYRTSSASNTFQINYVNVVVSYKWQYPSFPGFPAGSLTFTSQSRTPMAN